MPGDFVIVNGLAYKGREPQRGDIVVFVSHIDKMEGDTLIKRVIGIPNDSLMFIDGDLYINGMLYVEAYLKEGKKHVIIIIQVSTRIH